MMLKRVRANGIALQVPPSPVHMPWTWLHIGIADGMSNARLWARRYSKRPPRRELSDGDILVIITIMLP